MLNNILEPNEQTSSNFPCKFRRNNWIIIECSNLILFNLFINLIFFFVSLCGGVNESNKQNFLISNFQQRLRFNYHEIFALNNSYHRDLEVFAHSNKSTVYKIQLHPWLRYTKFMFNKIKRETHRSAHSQFPFVNKFMCVVCVCVWRRGDNFTNLKA